MLMHTLLAVLALAADPAQADPVIPNCVVGSPNDQAVPGPDPGVLTKLTVKLGSRVTKGMEIGSIDESEAKAQLDVKILEYKVAKNKGDSDVDIRYAIKQAEVSKAALEKLKQANNGVKGVVTEIEVQRAELEWQKGVLATEQARQTNASDKLTAEAKLAEANAAKVALERRILRAPFDGVVVKIAKHEGEWISPGDPVAYLVGTDRLNVSGNLDATQYDPSFIVDRKVTVDFELPGGRKVPISGKVVHVSPIKGKLLPIWAEIEVPKENGEPVVRTGFPASMTIHVSQPQVKEMSSTPVRRAPARAISKSAGKN